MSSPVKLLQRVRRRVQSVTYGSPIYKMMLDQGPVPERLRLTLNDPWPGDALAGQALIASQPGLFEQDFTPAKHRPIVAHDWLRDLRAVGTDSARRKALALLEDWLAGQDAWDEESWAPDVLGERLANWVSFYDFYSPLAAPDFQERLIVSMVRQLRHLLRTIPVTLTGVANLRAVKGLIYAGLSLIDSEKALSLALDLLQRQLEAEILPDGGHVSRCPAQQLQVLRYLIDIRAALRAVRLEVPHALQTAIERMVPALKLCRHGDGGLALFHGGREDRTLWIDAAITLAETRGRVLRRLPQAGYERVTAGRALLLVDVAAPPPRPYDEDAHAGLLSFEFSVGRERLIVNCGAGPESSAEWRQAMAATAAHSTLTLADTNVCDVLPDGGLGHRPLLVTAERYEQDGVHFVEAKHDGYAGKFRVTHHRALSLSADGEALHGREILSGPAGRAYTLRWHLHPGVQASLLQGGRAALLRTASGSGWRLRIETDHRGSTDLGLESSVYCGGALPRRTLQLKVTGCTNADPTIVGWTLTREKKGTAPA